MTNSLTSKTMDTTVAATDAAKVKEKVRTDHHLWGTYIFIVLISLVELFSASIQEVNAGNIYSPITRHAMFLGIGLVIMLVLQKIHFRYIYYIIPLYVVLTILAMVYVLAAGTKINGTMRAIQLGPVMVLPAEFLKLAVALGVTWILSRCQLKDRRDVSMSGFLWCLAFIMLCCGLIFEQGLTNTVLVASIGFAMMLIGGVSWRKFMMALLIVGSIGGTLVGLKAFTKSDEGPSERQITEATLNKEDIDESMGKDRGATWNARFSRHFRSDKHLDKIDDLNKQEQLSFIAQAHGGITGCGIGNSRENARLPLAFSDYIFAIIVEELGLFVALFLMLSYLWILGRGAALTMSFKQTMPGILVLGCAFVIVFQALMHMAIVSGFFPVSGQPLPLISKGGTSVIATSIAFGIMLSVSRHAARVRDNAGAVKRELEILPENLQSANPSAVNFNKNSDNNEQQ